MIKKAIKKPGGAAVKKALKKTTKVKAAPLGVNLDTPEINAFMASTTAPSYAPPELQPVVDAPVAAPRWTAVDTLIVIAGVGLGFLAVLFFF